MAAKVETVTGSLLLARNHADRRSKPRIYASFCVKVRGRAMNGERFETETTIDNLSAGGLYMRIGRLVAPRAKLFFIIRLSTDPVDRASAARIAVRGMVKRAEVQFDGSCGLAIVFTQHRFL